MSYQANLDGSRIISVVQAGDEREGWVAVDGAINWQARPSPQHYPHLIDGVVVWQDSRMLAEVKAAKWAQIKAARKAAIDAPLVTPYGTFDSNQESRAAISECAAQARAGGPTWSIYFTRADNTQVLLTAEEMVNVWMASGAKTQAARDAAVPLRMAISAATTAATVEAITWA